MNFPRILPLLFFSGMASPAYTADFGFGVSLNSPSLLAPIQLNDDYRLEPFLSYYASKNEDYRRGQSFYNREYSGSSFGIGLFKTAKLKQYIYSYWGLRLSYETEENSYKNKDDNSEAYSTNELTGYAISPVFGIEYSITDDLFIGLEGSWYYKSLSGNPSSYYNRTGSGWGENNGVVFIDDSESKRTGTESRITLRYLFN